MSGLFLCLDSVNALQRSHREQDAKRYVWIYGDSRDRGKTEVKTDHRSVAVNTNKIMECKEKTQ